MRPGADERMHAGVALRLCDLAFVVGKDQVRTAAVDVKRLATVPQCHRRALDMPARPSPPPRRLPRRLARRLRLPEQEVERITRAATHLLALVLRQHLVPAEMAQL